MRSSTSPSSPADSTSALFPGAHDGHTPSGTHAHTTPPPPSHQHGTEPSPPRTGDSGPRVSINAAVATSAGDQMDYVPGSGSADDAAAAADVGQWRSKKAMEDYERAM